MKRMQMATNEALPEKAGTEGADRASWEPRSMSTEEADGQESAECPTCGRDDFKTVRGMKRHHVAVHDESIAGVELTCERCGDTYRERPSLADNSRFCSQSCQHPNADGLESTTCPRCGETFKNRMAMKTHHAKEHDEALGMPGECEQCGGTFDKHQSSGRFCSRECYGEWLSENVAGESHHQYERTAKVCDWCSSEFDVRPSREGTARFCSRDCMGKWQSENKTGEDNPNAGEWVEIECEKCGTEMSYPAWRVEKWTPRFCKQCSATEMGECIICGTEFEYLPKQRPNAKFCSRECTGEWLKGRFTGEEHPRWAGGSAPYGPGWDESKKQAVRERDGFECQSCGMSQGEHTEATGRKLDVHHIVPARQVEDPGQRNSKDNLITLCTSCHRSWERMAPLRPMT